MTMDADERKEILDLLANGKISVESAAKLLSEGAGPTPDIEGKAGPITKSEPEWVDEPIVSEMGDGPSWFHVQVNDLHSGKSKVRVKIPVGVLKFGLDIGRRFASELNDLDIGELQAFSRSGNGLLVDVEDEEDGEHVRIYFD